MDKVRTPESTIYRSSRRKSSREKEGGGLSALLWAPAKWLVACGLIARGLREEQEEEEEESKQKENPGYREERGTNFKEPRVVGVRMSCISITDVCNLIRTQTSLGFKKDSSLHLGSLLKRNRKKEKKKKALISRKGICCSPLDPICGAFSFAPHQCHTTTTQVQFWCVCVMGRLRVRVTQSCGPPKPSASSSLSSTGTPGFGKGKKR